MNSQKTKNVMIFWVVITAIPIIGVFSSLFYPDLFFASQDVTREWILSYGIFAPLVIIVLQIIQVIFPPISHYLVGYLSGFIFGPIWGTLYNWLGRLVGHTTVFLATRRFGRPFVERKIPVQTIEKFDRITNNKYSAPMLLLIYFLPLFPDDELSYIAGLSKMRFITFFLCNVFGHISGSLALAYLGSGIQDKGIGFWIFTSVTLLGFPILLYIAKKKS